MSHPLDCRCAECVANTVYRETLMSKGVDTELLGIERIEPGGGRVIKRVMDDGVQTKDGAG